ncbi:30S ribosomal protein S21 [Candidatus Gribaldobacteria bacterium]|nr:30S ribosomal protein S21 [Candidatus Gribaldobacteria bacterium]
MPLKVEKQGKESSQNVLRRFSLKLRKSGLLLEARKKRFFKKKQSIPLKKRSALRRLAKKEEYLKQKKLGRV